MKYLIKTVKYLLIGTYAMCGVLLLVFALPQSGWKALTVLTGSMRPAINPGALVFVHRVPNRDLRVGDVITYINPRNTKQTITHRITKVTADQNLPAFITKGDANDSADPQILGGNVVGKVEWHVPYLGRVVNWTKTPLGLLLLLGIPALFIIWDEIRVLKRSLTKVDDGRSGEVAVDQPMQPQLRPVAQDQPMPRPTSAPAQVPPKTSAPAQPRQKRRGMDGMMRVVALVVLISATIGSTKALVHSNSVTLTDNKLSVASALPVNHILINRVYLGGIALGPCPPSTTQINLGNTGPASINQINTSLNCNVNITNTNNVLIQNKNSQSSSTGSANNSGNTNGGSASTGNSTNNNSANSNVNINNGGGGQSQTLAWVELYNPTSSTVFLNNWQLTDDSGAVQFITRAIPGHGYAIIAGPFGNGLNPSGDRVTLATGLGIVVDKVSWGSDVNAFSPSIPALSSGSVIARKVLAVDTDSATDWQILP